MLNILILIFCTFFYLITNIGYSARMHKFTTMCILCCYFWPQSSYIMHYQLTPNICIDHHTNSTIHMLHIYCIDNPCHSYTWLKFLYKLPLQYPTVLVVAHNQLWQDALRFNLPTSIKQDWIFTPDRFAPSTTQNCTQVQNLLPIKFINKDQYCQLLP